MEYTAHVAHAGRLVRVLAAVEHLVRLIADHCTDLIHIACLVTDRKAVVSMLHCHQAVQAGGFCPDRLSVGIDLVPHRSWFVDEFSVLMLRRNKGDQCWNELTWSSSVSRAELGLCKNWEF